MEGIIADGGILNVDNESMIWRRGEKIKMKLRMRAARKRLNADIKCLHQDNESKLNSVTNAVVKIHNLE